MIEFVDCREVLERVHLFLDDELSAEDGDAMRRHLLACEHCLDHFDVEQEVRSLLKRCCSLDRAPETLRVRVMTAVREGSVASVEVHSVEIHHTVERQTRPAG